MRYLSYKKKTFEDVINKMVATHFVSTVMFYAKNYLCEGILVKTDMASC